MSLGMEVGLGPGHIVLGGYQLLLPKIFDPCLWYPNGYMDQDATWYGGRPRPRPHCARWGPRSPSPESGHRPQFSAPVCCDQTAGWIKMPLRVMVGLGPGNIVLDADPAPPRSGTAPPNSAHVCCGQNAGWIKMPLGTKVGLGPGRIVLHGDPAPPPKKGTAPNFQPMSILV